MGEVLASVCLLWRNKAAKQTRGNNSLRDLVQNRSQEKNEVFEQNGKKRLNKALVNLKCEASLFDFTENF